MPKKVLVADDQIHIRKIIAAKISKAGYTVITAEDGQEAVDMAKAEKPDLIIMDIMMPRMNGIEVLKKIKKMKKEIVVIMLTAYGTLETARKAMKLGAYDYLTKPFDLFNLKPLVKEALGRVCKPR